MKGFSVINIELTKKGRPVRSSPFPVKNAFVIKGELLRRTPLRWHLSPLRSWSGAGGRC